MKTSWAKSYRGAVTAFNRHWVIYGGWRALVSSIYLHIAFVFTALAYPEWIAGKWWDQAIAVLPGLIGFSLGGFAIWLAFGGDKFQEMLAGKFPGDDDDETSPYLDTAAAFAHFVIIQTMGLLFAVGCNAHADTIVTLGPFAWLINFFGYWLYIYGLLSVLAATYAVFSLAWFFDMHVTNQRGADSNGKPKNEVEKASSGSTPGE